MPARSAIDREGVVLAGIVTACALALAADLLTPIGFAVWIFYIVPIVLALFGRRAWLPVAAAGAATLLIAVGYVLSPSTAGFPLGIAQANRALGVFTLWIVAAIVRRLVASRVELERRDWLKDALASVASKVQGEHTPASLADAVLGVAASRLEAPVAILYAALEGGGPHRRIGARGTVSPSALPEQLVPGVGLSGQALRDAALLRLDGVPDEYLRVSSALGSALPRHVVALPLTADRDVVGVVELALLRAPDALQLEFLRAAAEPAGVALRSLAYRMRLADLLEETQRQAEELQAQQEELRTANEELERNNRALRESEARLETNQAELEAAGTRVQEQADALERQRDALLAAQAELQARADDLQRADRYKSEFLANMSHELRTPLNSALILSKLLADNGGGNLTAEQVRHAETIHSATNDLLALINDILDLARVEAGRMEMEVLPVPVATVMDSLVRLFQPMADEKRLGFVREIDPHAPREIRTDPRRLQQVLRNLLSNAFKFTAEGVVTLAVRPRPAGQLVFEVRDTGIGIAEDQLDLIFEAFRQASGGIERRYGGTGLGLSLSRRLARRLGGDIAVESRPGVGSLFTLTLPVEAPPDGADTPESRNRAPAPPWQAARTPDRGRTDGTRVAQDGEPTVAPPPEEVADDRNLLQADDRVALVVEDDVRFAAILRDLCREQGLRCVVATTAGEALRLAAARTPTAVLLDVQLPDDSGLTVLEYFKRTPMLRHVPVHVISVADYAEQALGLGAAGYALKPVARDQLLHALDRLRERAGGGVRRVLVVEDAAAQRQSVRQLLENDGVEVVDVGAGADALAALRERTWDCMVLDLALPDMTGFDVLDRMVADPAFSFPPVIVYTGRSLTRDEEVRLRRYARSIVVKGARSPERLLDEVTLFLHQVESRLPEDKQRMLRDVRARDEVLDGRRILLVEDDVRNVFALTSVLEPRGLVLQVARDGREALAALARSAGEVDLVLMDLMMPEMDGLTAIREIRAREEWKKLPVIALTAKAMPDDRRQCIEAGASDYVTKPIDVDKLVSLIRVWLPR